MRLVDFDEVVAKDEQADGMPQVFDFLAESQCQPCEPAVEQAVGQIRALDKARADSASVGFATAHDNPRADAIAGRVAAFARLGIRWIAVELYELGKINVLAQCARGARLVCLVTIGRQLEMFGDAAPQILQKGFRLDWRTSAQDVRNDELAARIKTEEKELIAAKRVIVSVVRFLAPDKAPCFIRLD